MRAFGGRTRFSHKPWFFACSPQTRPFSMRQTPGAVATQSGPGSSSPASPPRRRPRPAAGRGGDDPVLEIVVERDLHHVGSRRRWARAPGPNGARFARSTGPASEGTALPGGTHPPTASNAATAANAHDAAPNVSHRRTDLSQGSERDRLRARGHRTGRAPNCTPLRCAPHGFLVNEGPSSHAPDPLSHPAAALAAQALVGSGRRDGDRAPLCRGGREPPREERRDHRGRRRRSRPQGPGGSGAP